ncbi:MAG: YlbF family regulator [Clostridia bacterium]|nr:YlbF family regulator [Clostridia bacterium]
MDVVFQKTRELGQALLESEAYLNMKKAEDKAMANEEAARAMGTYLEKRTQLQDLMQGENPDPGALKRVADEMDEAQEKLQLIDDVAELTAARNEFNALIGQINQVLQFIVTGNMEESSGCTGSCDSCPGCH